MDKKEDAGDSTSPVGNAGDALASPGVERRTWTSKKETEGGFPGLAISHEGSDGFHYRR